MSAEQVRLIPFTLPLRRPMITAATTTLERTGILVAVEADGITGWGEATPLPGWSPDDLATVAATLERVAAAPAIREAAPSLRGSARAAVIGALADLDARREGRPLAAAFADRPRPEVVANAVVGGGSVDQVEEACRAALADGFATIKLKVGAAAPALDGERIAAARAVLGSTPRLRLDANRAWDHATALDVLTVAADHDIEWCEEPVVDDLAGFVPSSPVPVGLDESASTVDDVEQLLDAARFAAVVVKPQAIGGPDLAVRALERAADHGATGVVTTMIDGAVGVAHAVHVAAAAGADTAHGLATSALLADDVAAPLAVVHGSIAATGPGIGIDP